MREDMYKIDKRVKPLVSLLNTMPDISTRSSCGGHKYPEIGQCPQDKFCISIDFEPTKHGFLSLGIIVTAIQELNWNIGKDCFSIIPWTEGDPRTLAFEIEGNDHVDPDELYIEILAAAEKFLPVVIKRIKSRKCRHK
jgi:hypothetical protein